MTMMVKKGDPKQEFQVFIVVQPVIAGFPFGTAQPIPLLPYPKRMRLYPTQVFDVPDGKSVGRIGY